MLLKFADWFFMIFHSALVIFNMTGWIWRRTMRLHFITIALTAFSWVFLGFWYGFGYCPFTDWHWKVLVKRGITDLPDSYLKFLIDRIFGTDTDALLVDRATLIIFIIIVILAIYNFLRLRGRWRLD